MAVRIKCPVSTCGVVCSANEAMLGRSVKCPKCGGAFVASQTLDGRQTQDTKKNRRTATEEAFPVLPAAFGRYRVLELLGRGGMGAVYLAEDSQLGRKVALKIPFIAGSDAVRVERFAREARSAAGLHHPNICTVFDAGTIDGRPFITMAYVAGQPLDQLIDPDAPMPVRRAVEIVRGVARALAYAHEHGVTHRDLKPANVMLTPAGEPVVMDFGLAKLAADTDAGEAKPGGNVEPDGALNELKLTREGGLLGTPSYMSPEQVRGDVGAVGPASDVYGLGAVLFELLTGHPPYTGPLTAVLGQILAAPVPSLTEYRKDAPVWLAAICEQALAKEPSARFSGMSEFARVLDAHLEPTGAARPEVASRTTILPTPATKAEPASTVEPPVPESPFEQVAAPAVTTAATPPEWRRPVLIAAAVLLPLLAWGAVVALRVETPKGTLVVELDDPAVEARIKNGIMILSSPDGKDHYTLSVTDRDKTIDAGKYKVRVEGAFGLLLDPPEFTLEQGGRVTLRVKLEPQAVRPPGAAPASPTLTDGFTPLFNGKSLVGWHTVGGASWAIEDGDIIGSGPAGYLVTDRSHYNFTLRAEVLVPDGENGGVFLRYADSAGLRGYEIDLNTPGRGGKETGSIIVYDTGRKNTHPGVLVQTQNHKSGEWFRLEVGVKGSRITATVNGVRVADYTDTKALLPEGAIALQHYVPGGSIRFRKIAIAE